MRQRDSEIQGMHGRVAEAERKCEESLKEHQRRTKEIEVQFADKERTLQDNLRKQMQRMIAEQSREIEDLQGEFSSASGLMTDKYNQLNERFLELQDLYEGRPSRPEDLEMLKDLND